MQILMTAFICIAIGLGLALYVNLTSGDQNLLALVSIVFSVSGALLSVVWMRNEPR